MKTSIPGLDPDGFNELAACRYGPMLYNKNDRFLGESLQKYGEFSIFEQRLFEQLVRSGDTVVEVGANIGAHTVRLAQLADPGFVYAFEPQRIVFQTLCGNLAINQRWNVSARQVAVGAAPGMLMEPALRPWQRHSFGSVELSTEYQGGANVPVITLDGLDLSSCSFIKVDVEGMEVDVLRGAQETIVRHQPLLYVENDREARSEELLEQIASLGYAAYWHFPPLFNPDNFAGEKENIFPNMVSVNMLCAPQHRPIRGMRPVASPKETWQHAAAAEREEYAR